MKNQLIDKIVCNLRESVGVKLLPKKNVLKDLLLSLKQNKAIGLLSDQNAGHDGVFVDFLGREASTVTSPVIFSLMRMGGGTLPQRSFQGQCPLFYRGGSFHFYLLPIPSLFSLLY